MGGEHVQVKGFTERGPNPQSEIRNPKSNDPIGYAGPDHPAAAPLDSLECAPEKRSFSANPGAGGATHLGFWILVISDFWDCGPPHSAEQSQIENRKSKMAWAPEAQRIWDFGFRIADFWDREPPRSAEQSQIENRKSKMAGAREAQRIWDFGFWIADFWDCGPPHSAEQSQIENRKSKMAWAPEAQH